MRHAVATKFSSLPGRSRLAALLLALVCLAPTTARAEILEGVAAIIAAGAPAVVAGIQARADQTIAAINADAAIQMTQIVSQTSIELAGMQKEVALAQTYAAQNINQMNQDGVTDRLKLQLGALAEAREDARQAERERMRSQYLLDQQRIALAERQAAANLQLAREAARYQMTQAGMANGVTNTLAGGNLLTFSRPGTQLAMATPSAAGDTATRAAVEGEAPAAETAAIPARQQPRVIQAKSTRAVVTGRKPPPTRSSGGKASAQLLASVQSPGSNVGGESWSSSPGLTGSLTRRSAALMSEQTARGSSPSNLRRIAVAPAPLATPRPFMALGEPHRQRQPASETVYATAPPDAPAVSAGESTGTHAAAAY